MCLGMILVRAVIIVVFCLSVNHQEDWSVMFVIIIFHLVSIVISKKETITGALPAVGSAREKFIVVLEILVTKKRITRIAARVIGQRIGGQIINVRAIGSREDGLKDGVIRRA